MKNNKNGYSVILALLMTSFILILVAGVFKLILENMYDTRGMQNYLSAYQASEGAMELALKKVKENDFGFEQHIFIQAPDSNPYIKLLYNSNKDPIIGYDINSTSSGILNVSLLANSYAIYPLLNLTKPKFEINTGDAASLVWNIVGKDGGMSGTGNFTYNLSKDVKKMNLSGNFEFTSKSIENFLSNTNDNYLVLYNAGNSEINYNLKSEDITKNFALEDINIVSVGKLGSYKQNLNVDLNIGNKLNLLKYSLLSPEN